MTEQTKSFREKWLEAVERKNSVLCAGLDPAEFDMGRGEKGLPEGAGKLTWSREYIYAVAPYCAALKPNYQYWKSVGGEAALRSLSVLAHREGMVVIDDSKLADIGSTNDAGVYSSAQRADAVTFSPFAGNLEEATKQAHARGLGLISMVLMSNPEYEREKNKLVNIPLQEIATSKYDENDFVYLSISSKPARSPYVRQYVQLAHDARKFGTDAIVIGAPSEKNHIKEQEMERVREYSRDDMLVLSPGLGAQGGEAKAIWKYFGQRNVIVNVGRALMLPRGSKSTPEQQAETARQYRDMLNDLRA